MSRDPLYEKLIRPVLFSMDPELVHSFAASVLGAAKPLLPAMGLSYRQDDLQADLFGTQLSNPIGLAAGFDKNAKLLPMLAGLGFGYAEIGSICARPHGGNLRPRLFRLPKDNALINRLGLNGLGAEVVAMNLEKMDALSLPIGINIAKTNDASISGEAAVQDIVYSFERIRNLPIKYVTINASCPNTDEGCLKESQMLGKVLAQISERNERQLPLLIKLSPDSKDDFIEEIVSLATEHKVSGFVCGNTTLKRDNLQSDGQLLAAIGAGGLSGKPLKELNLDLTRRVALLKQSGQIIIAVGGIECGADAYDYLCAGAHLLQIYTGFVYRGPAAVKGICEELSQILRSKSMNLKLLCGHRA